MSPEQDIILSSRQMSKDFGGFKAVEDVSIDVRRGTIHALIGPNGAGKTTCFSLFTKFLMPSSGTITFKGEDITFLRPEQVARRGMVRSFQISAVFTDLSVLENVRVALQRHRSDCYSFWRSARGLGELNDRAAQLLDDVGLLSLSTLRAAELSYGRKRALEVATTLALDPEMLLLDEPMAGLGHEDIDRIAQLIKRISANRTVLMVEHNLSVVASLCDRITMLARGKVLAEGDYETVSRDERVIQAYIGKRHV